MTLLITQASALRTTLLLSLGLSSLACGGTTVSSGGGGGATNQGGGGATDQGGGGATNQGNGGTTSEAGSISSGGVAGKPPLRDLGPTDCPDPKFNPTTKLIECSNGRAHRAEALKCTFNDPSVASGGTSAASAGAGGAAFVECLTDDACTGLNHGYCKHDPGYPGLCKAGCASDSDCGASEICACNGVNPGRCIKASCVTDADCGSDSLCALSPITCGSEPALECTSTEDQCISSADCETGWLCTKNPPHICQNVSCGRPFLIADTARLAAVASRTDWLDATLTPDASDLSPLERAQLAAHWARLGQMEHASIAAFARFNLQLLSLGAASHLVEACNRALADETAHARSCFALASAYGGTAVGPARLDIEHCFEDTSLVAIAKLVLREGCLGETVAALEAAAAAEVARDPAVKRALERITRDELEHAKLALQFFRWALSVSSPEVRRELADEAAQQLAGFERDAQQSQRTPTDDRLAAHGLLGGDALRAIHLAAVRDVSRPLLTALFRQEECSSAT